MEKVCKYCIVKRKGHEEEFDERKVYATCYSACLAAHIEHIKAEGICNDVSKEIKKWIKDKKSVTAEQIHKKMVTSIGKFDKNAAFMYDTHKDIA